ncbi:39S ribosomal protein L44, mitochondrial [Sander lucioperca]|nr:39S ribosomal protein L44, mitochondrial [Sander lucioperca]
MLFLVPCRTVLAVALSCLLSTMASGFILNRGVLTLGIHCQRVCRNVSLSQVREKKRWMKAYTHLMAKKLKLEGPPPPKPRSQQPHWDYHAEVQAFSSRLHENFSLDVLKTAFINPCYLQAEQERRKGLGVDSGTTALVLKDNVQLSRKGAGFTKSFLTDWCGASFPSLPSEGVESVVGHLTSSAVVTYVARNLGIEDLTMSAECPVPDDVLHSTFMAVIGVLQESSGAEQTGLFLRDFLVTQLIGKDLFDMWTVINPMGLLVEELTKRNVPLPEPRLIRSAGASTVLPLYFVGLYSNKKLLAQGPGETLAAAEDEAARVALRKLYGYTENHRPFDFSPLQQHQQPLIQSVSSN